MADYQGTLAAVRCLGERGVPVVVASSSLASASVWSRYASERLPCPDAARGPSALMAWLERLGRARPAMVLYPTSDEWAWTLSYGVAELSRSFAMYSPAIAATHTLLDKSALYSLCASLSIPTPRTYRPHDASEAVELVRTHGSLLLKPRCQAFCLGNGKGELLRDARHVRSVFNRYASARYPRELLARSPDLALPLLQEYAPSGASATYSLSGFIDREGRILACLGSVKTCQSPPGVGIGLEFEAAPVREAARAAVEKLCRHVGYFGVFEVEFVSRGDQLLLVDFNPRYFGQIGFDIARGSSLPWLVQLCATGFEDEARAFAVQRPVSAPSSFANRVSLGFELLTSLRQPARARAAASSLARAMRHDSPDSHWSPHDPAPAFAAAAELARWALYHPRTFVRLLLRKPE